ncbi:MAG: hypothetical protein SF052_22205 [Bacteroidia bacterium]|nr:hypothetical protein [Bacteroidia bacterium]
MNLNKNLLYTILLTASFLAVTFFSCQPDDTPPPPNPYDLVDYGEPPAPLPQPDSGTLVGLHTYIFSKSCAVPGCHDGNFEPDFRTVQSTYSTLVFQPVVKNNTAQTYTWRVLPFDVNESWLSNRITTNDQILGRMPLYDNPLTPGQVKAVEKWINAGAPDMFGKVSSLPNTQPQFVGMAAFADFGGIEYRIDTIRGNNVFNPFASLKNLNITIWMAVSDDSTALSAFKNSRMLFSEEFDDFGGATQISATYSPTPKVITNWYDTGNTVELNWKITFNTNLFPTGKVIFFRYYTNDGGHAEDFEFPRSTHPNEFKTFMSFYIVP